jgi:anti-sigma regulatory factor (Ser/Thr protein kinase)
MQDSHPRTGRRRAQFSFALAPDAHAPATARQELTARLAGALPPELVDDILLLATELVTNGVRHSPAADGGSVDVGVFLEPASIRVEVSDPGSGFSHVPHRPGTMSEGGRGLFLVEVLADRWGIAEADGTTVWFELDVEEGDADAPAAAAHEAAPGQDTVAGEAFELAAELKALGNETRSLERRARDMEAELARVAGNLRTGAEALRAREKLAHPERRPDQSPS